MFNNIQTPNNLSFQAMKKSQFSGIDRFVVDKYKFPIEKFNDMGDFFTYCGNEVDNIEYTDFAGRQKETQIQRQGMLKEWFNYVIYENDAYTKPIELMILKGITNKLKPNEDKLPPVLNKGVLAKTVEETQKTLETNPKAQFDFEKIYRKNLQKEVTDNYGADNDYTGWIVIPSKKNDPENFEANVEKLKALSHPSWCTKSYNAEPYLSGGDFHVYLENGKPALGVRFNSSNVIMEIQGPKNNGKIPLRYYKMTDYFKKYDLSHNAEEEIRELQKRTSRISARFPKGIENYSTEQIFNKCGIKCKKDKDGLLIISKLKKPYPDMSFWDMGANLNDMLKEVKEVEGDADFEDADTFGNIRKIGGLANIYRTGVNDIGKLEYAGKGISYNDHNKNQVLLVQELKSRMAEYIKRNMFPDGVENYSTKQILETFGIKCKENKSGMLTINEYRQPIEDFVTFSDLGINENNLLKDITEIEDLANFRESNATSLGSVKKTGGGLILTNSNIKDISSLEYAGWHITFDNFPRNLLFQNSKNQKHGITQQEVDKAIKRTRKTFMKEHFPKGIGRYSTKEILEAFDIKCRTILFGRNAGKLVISHYRSPMNPNLNLKAMGINEDEMFKEIAVIKKHAVFNDTNVTDLGSVEKIGDEVNFSGSKIKSIGNLKYVGGAVIYGHSNLKPEDFSSVKIKGHLEYI